MDWRLVDRSIALVPASSISNLNMLMLQVVAVIENVFAMGLEKMIIFGTRR
jgi:hypothetical protein